MDPGDEMIMIQKVVGGRKSRLKSPRTRKRRTKEHELNIKCSHGLANSSSNPKIKGNGTKSMVGPVAGAVTRIKKVLKTEQVVTVYYTDTPVIKAGTCSLISLQAATEQAAGLAAMPQTIPAPMSTPASKITASTAYAGMNKDACQQGNSMIGEQLRGYQQPSLLFNVIPTAEGTRSLIGLQAATEQAAGLASMPQTIPAPMSTPASKITASMAYAGMNKDACQQGNSMIGEQLRGYQQTSLLFNVVPTAEGTRSLISLQAATEQAAGLAAMPQTIPAPMSTPASKITASTAYAGMNKDACQQGNSMIGEQLRGYQQPSLLFNVIPTAEGTRSLIGLQAATEQAAGLASMPQTIPAPMSTPASKITASMAYAGMNKDACQQGNSMIGEQLRGYQQTSLLFNVVPTAEGTRSLISLQAATEQAAGLAAMPQTIPAPMSTPASKITASTAYAGMNKDACQQGNSMIGEQLRGYQQPSLLFNVIPTAEGTRSLIGLQAATEQAAGLASMPQTIPAPMSTPASKITASMAYAGMNKDACQQGNSMIGEQLRGYQQTSLLFNVVPTAEGTRSLISLQAATEQAAGLAAMPQTIPAPMSTPASKITASTAYAGMNKDACQQGNSMIGEQLRGYQQPSLLFNVIPTAEGTRSLIGLQAATEQAAGLASMPQTIPAPMSTPASKITASMAYAGMNKDACQQGNSMIGEQLRGYQQTSLLFNVVPTAEGTRSLISLQAATEQAAGLAAMPQTIPAPMSTPASKITASTAYAGMNKDACQQGNSMIGEQLRGYQQPSLLFNVIPTAEGTRSLIGLQAATEQAAGLASMPQTIPAPMSTPASKITASMAYAGMNKDACQQGNSMIGEQLRGYQQTSLLFNVVPTAEDTDMNTSMMEQFPSASATPPSKLGPGVAKRKLFSSPHFSSSPRSNKLKMAALKAKVKRLEKKLQQVEEDRIWDQVGRRREPMATSSQLPTIVQKIYEAQVQIGKIHKHGYRWSDVMKDFSLSLFYHSPKGYNFMEKLFLLPSIKTLQSYQNKIDIQPGLMQPVLTTLKPLAAGPLSDRSENVCSLIIDEIAICQQLHYDSKSDMIKGFADDGIARYPMKIGNHCLMAMVKGIKKGWKQQCTQM
ncbi:uncharacterized protein [Periplaneta americana]|uniref:uncharacterized protein n=1 Tax=Periplaneta americana TaxID=6978 RepID=UPI0037E6F93E